MKIKGKIKCPVCNSNNVHPWLLKQANIWDDGVHQEHIKAFKDRVRISSSCDNVIYECRCEDCGVHFCTMVTVDVSIKDIYVGKELYEVDGLKIYEADKLKQVHVEREPIGKVAPFNNHIDKFIRPEVPGDINKFFYGHDNIQVKEYTLDSELDLVKESMCGVGITTKSIIHRLTEDGKNDYIGAIQIFGGVNLLYTALPSDMMKIEDNTLTIYRIEDGREFHIEFTIVDK